MRQTTLTLLLLACLLSRPVLARGDAEPVPEGDGARAPVTQRAEQEAEAPATGNEDQSIYVVQRRAYSKSGKLEVTPIFFTSLNNKFVGHLGGAIATAYHLRENLAVELTSAVPYGIFAFYSGLVFEVYDYESLTPEVVDLKQMSYFGSLCAQYSAVYGKFEFYGVLIDYDLFVTAGFGLAATKETCVPEKNGCSKDLGIGRGLRKPKKNSDRYKLTGNLGGGMRFFFQDWAGLRIEVRDIAYADRAVDAGEVTTDIRSHVLFMLGFTLLI